MPIWVPRLAGLVDEPLFRQIVQSLSDDIASGRLRAGALLPTHRWLADKLGVARGTVARAYDEAEKLGLVSGQVGRGTQVQSRDTGERAFSPLLEPPTVVSDLTTSHRPLAGIDPDLAGALRALATRPDRNSLLGYQSQLGSLRHRQLGVTWARRFGVTADVTQVLPCAGAQHALFLSLAHTARPGDAVLVEEWSYPGLIGIAETLRLNLVPVPVDAQGARPDGIAAACRRQKPRAFYCMPTMHNPLGFVASAERRAAWADLARRHDFALIEDDAYRLLLTDAPEPVSVHAPERTYFIASTSKALGPGLRVAFLVAPRESLAALGRHLWATQWMVSPLGLEVVAHWVATGQADSALRKRRREAVVRQRLARELFAGQQVVGHPSALHLWLWLGRGRDAEQVAARARSLGVGVTPSTAFWLGRGRPRQALRVALGGVDRRSALRSGLERLVSALEGSGATGAGTRASTRPPP